MFSATTFYIYTTELYPSNIQDQIGGVQQVPNLPTEFVFRE